MQFWILGDLNLAKNLYGKAIKQMIKMHFIHDFGVFYQHKITYYQYEKLN